VETVRRGHRKTTPKVQGGRPLRKNNWSLSTHYSQTAEVEIRVDRQRPGRGYRHLISKADIVRFIALLPEWDHLSEGLDAIVLAPGERSTDGYHQYGAVAICAWSTGLWKIHGRSYYDEHRSIIDRLGVESEPVDDRVRVKWTEETARAYQLLHILLHELGHHHDRVTTRSQRAPARGEPYAEEYARRYFDRIFDAYRVSFGL
jgi:hypothetical protein